MACLDEGWGALGAGHLSEAAESRYHPRLGAELVQAALSALDHGLAPSERERVGAILTDTWQRCAHDAAWLASKSAPGRSRAAASARGFRARRALIPLGCLPVALALPPVLRYRPDLDL